MKKLKIRSNKKRKKSYGSKTKQEQTKFLVSFLKQIKDLPCEDCKKTYPYYVMDLDHVTGKKVNNVSTMARNGETTEVILQEILKCEVVCSNCHRERTFKRLQARTVKKSA